MSIKTGISWTDSTWSPLRVRVRDNAGEIARQKGYTSLVQIGDKMAGRVGHHCEHVSAGCRHCYSETWQSRCLGPNGTGLPFDRRSRDLVEGVVDEKALLTPLKWKSIKQPDGTTRPRRIFVENQSDLFGEWFSDEQIDQAFAVMALCPEQTFQVLTKRPQRMLEYLHYAQARLTGIHERNKAVIRMATLVASLARTSAVKRIRVASFEGSITRLQWPLPNVWIGVSVEDQATADARIPLLLQTPAAVRFISLEPQLGPVDFSKWIGYNPFHEINESRSCSPRGCDGRMDRDQAGRISVATLSAEEESMGRSDREARFAPSSDRQSGAERLPSSSHHGGREADMRLSAPVGLVPPSRPNTAIFDDQPQERQQARQQAGELGVDDVLGERETCVSDGAEGPAWGGQSSGQIERLGCGGNPRSILARWGDASSISFPVQRAMPADISCGERGQETETGRPDDGLYQQTPARLSMIIVGGESGPGARPFDVRWARDVRDQCNAAGVAYFLKQLGAKPYIDPDPVGSSVTVMSDAYSLSCQLAEIRNRSGADPSEWPEDLRSQEFPK